MVVPKHKKSSIPHSRQPRTLNSKLGLFILDLDVQEIVRMHDDPILPFHSLMGAR